MGLLDSPYVGQLIKEGVAEKTFSTSGWLLTNNVKLNGRNVIRFRITVTDGTLDGGASYVELRGSITESTLDAIRCYKLDGKTLDENGADYITTLAKLTAGDYVSMDLSLVSNINFYVVTTNSVSVKIEYTLNFSNNILRNTNTLIGNLITTISNQNALIEDLSKPVDLLIKQETYDISATGNHFFSLNLKTLASQYKAVRIDVLFSAVDANVILILNHTFGTTAQSPRTYSIPILDEEGYYNTAIIANENKKLNASYYCEQLATNYCLRCDRAGASGLTCTVKVYATAFVPVKRHIHLLNSVSITATSTAAYMNIDLSQAISRFKFFFVTLEGTGLTGSIYKNFLTSDDNGDLTIMEFDNKSLVATSWLPVVLESGRMTAKVSGSGTTTMKLFGVI